MINYLDLIILGLATYRISHMIVWEDGPFKIFMKMQSWCERNDFLTDLLSCVWCLSVWVGAILVFSAIMDKIVTIYLMLPFALSAIAAILEEKING